jgi:hypothetical protein
MRLHIALLALAGTLLSPVIAGAQAPAVDFATTGYRGLTPDDMKAYCFWNGQLFSLGASFCIRPSAVTTCTEDRSGGRPTWVSKDNEKSCEKAPTNPPQ